MKEMKLTELKIKHTAVITEVLGGHDAIKRFEALGIRPGKSITKISAHFWRGPVTVMVDKSKVAIGHGMAQKILVEA